MDPFSAALGIAGLGLQLWGSYEKSQAASQASAYQQQEIGLEQKAEGIRKDYMETDYRRKSLEVLRNAQRASALATNNATTSGAQFGSGLQGGLGQIQGEANWNLAGINNAVSFGRQMFDVNQQISNTKIGQSQANARSNEGGGYSNLGGMLISGMKPLHELTGFNAGRGGNSTMSYAAGPNGPDTGIGGMSPMFEA